jgi:hypothetical protein
MCAVFGQSEEDCVNCQTNQLPAISTGAIELVEQASVEDPQLPPLVEILKVKLKRNNKAVRCIRNTDVVDTIVLHHSESGTKQRIQDINQYHLNQGTAADPWLMIGYHYTINSPYSNQNFKSSITEGRPIEIVGAHVGGGSYEQPSLETRAILEKNPIKCGKESGIQTQAADTFRAVAGIAATEAKANVTTVGIVVIGNYALYSRANPGGFSASKPRIPTKETLELTAKLSCELQRKHPRIKNIKWHNYYKDTSCPGLLKDYIGQIKAIAKGYGCEFF